MKTRSALLLGCLVFVVAIFAAFYLGYRFVSRSAVTTVSNDSWLVLDLNGEVTDYNEIEAPEFWGLNNPGIREICQRIRHAADDGRIKGIVIKPGAAMIGYANLNEIAAALKDFKASKKPVLAHGEILTQRDYLLCAMADKVNMDPTASGGLILEGVAANVLFYKEALDKLGIKMHVMQAGEFKGSGEPYIQTSLSKGTEDNLRKVLKSRYDLIQADIAKYRHLDSTAVKGVFENRPDYIINAKEALRYGLIDQVSTWDEFAFANKIDQDNCVSVRHYGSEPSISGSPAKIAVLNLTGNIAPSEGFESQGVISYKKVDKVLDDLAKDPTLKAVVLRVNSPGGSATESELIYQRLQELKVPVVVSMGGMAASGGYYISCAGDYIFADPQCITGSIGVLMALPEAVGLGNKLGLDSQTLSYGKYASFGSILEPYDPELLNSLKRNSEAVYTEFKQRVADACKFKPEQLAQVTEGRVFSAADAKTNGLIDEVGGLDAAVKKAAALAGVTKYSTQQYPKKISFFELMREGGFFRMASNLLTARKLSPEERLREYLERTFVTRQWLFFCPFKLD